MIPLREIKLNSLMMVSQPLEQSIKCSWVGGWAIGFPITKLTVSSMNKALEGASLQVCETESKQNWGS